MYLLYFYAFQERKFFFNILTQFKTSVKLIFLEPFHFF